ncbi:MAG: YlmH/Sll1252 family protein [bacterium]|nr:YlmH/Sll1252 family protein [bacterium]MDY4099071.1 YlmH/Sll1252 family protein [Lachnospiraceae bacterium]
MNEEATYFAKRCMDLSKQANRKGIVTFSDFLTINEQLILKQNKDKLESEYQMSGGYEYAERQMVAFIPDALFYEWDYPMQCVRIRPAYPKFAEQLSHRDVLGALMSLGIERSKIGDLIVNETDMFFFAKEEIVPYISDQLTSIRHTVVTLEIEAGSHLDYVPHFEEREAIVTSNRLDAVIAAICKISRAASLKLIQEGKIFVNGAECLHNTYYCKQGDLLSIRGFGKVRFGETLGVTKKDRIRFSYQLFT